MSTSNGAASARALLAELLDARAELMAALETADPALLTAPGLAGDWSARELIAHLGYWDGHAAEALHLASQGRLAELEAEGEIDVDEVNRTVARIAAETPLGTVRKREEAAFQALVEALQSVDDAWLTELSGAGEALEQIVREDGADHYREHLADVRAWFGGAEDEDNDDGDGGDGHGEAD